MKLETQDLHVYYGAMHALKSASLGMPDRSVTALIGPSGCGKSTFLRALNRMHDLAPGARVTGEIRLDNQPISQLRPEELRCRVGMVFQRPNPFPMSIYENVAFGPSLLGVRGRALDRMVQVSLERGALWGEVRKRLTADARGLSGGQQQRLCIARALAMEPAVLLMDEPCSALDPGSTQAVEELILHLKREMAIVLVTHSMGQARRVADQVAFFHSGRLVETGPASQVLGQPGTPELAQFLAQ
ncbi:MAG TPA: phosphate ABC transporter ATP-binding protein [Symbiobacteriaceae bacterium]|jgi:phosphate transport system ATP-binding protein|nr:phosphate ABC transporter ATP-binding protein [Symbiobacteriaceae bacterium]